MVQQYNNLQENGVGLGSHFSLVLMPNSESSGGWFIQENTQLMTEINKQTYFSLKNMLQFLCWNTLILY